MKVFIDKEFFNTKKGMVYGKSSPHAGVQRRNILQPREFAGEFNPSWPSSTFLMTTTKVGELREIICVLGGKALIQHHPDGILLAKGEEC